MAPRVCSGPMRRFMHVLLVFPLLKQCEADFQILLRSDWHSACIYIATVEEWDGGLGRSQAGA